MLQENHPLLSRNVSVQLPTQEPALRYSLKYCLLGEFVITGTVPHSELAMYNWGSHLWEWTSLDLSAYFIQDLTQLIEIYGSHSEIFSK